MHMNWTEILNTPHSLFANTNTRCCNRRWCHKSDSVAYLWGALMKDCICQVRLRLKGFFQLILVFSGEQMNLACIFLWHLMQVRDSRVARRGSVVHRNRPEELYPSDYPEWEEDKVCTWRSSLRDNVRTLCRNSLWSDDFLKFVLTARTDLTCLFGLKMDRCFRRVRHERIKGKTFCSYWFFLCRRHRSELWSSCHTRVKDEICLQKSKRTNAAFTVKQLHFLPLI